MKIRDYNKKDKDAVQSIFTKYWTDEEFLGELSEYIDGGKMHYYIAEKDNEVVGVAGFREAPEYLRFYAETKNPAELHIVASKLKNEGVGSLLVKEGKRRAVTE